MQSFSLFTFLSKITDKSLILPDHFIQTFFQAILFEYT